MEHGRGQEGGEVYGRGPVMRNEQRYRIARSSDECGGLRLVCGTASMK